VTPDLPTLQLANLRGELLKAHTSLALSYSFPVYILGATFSVATFIVERAGARAGLAAGGADGDGASLGIGADSGESELHGSVSVEDLRILAGDGASCGQPRYKA